LFLTKNTQVGAKMTKDSVTDKYNKKQDIFDQIRWGLPQEAIDDLATRLRDIWSHFGECFTTKICDTS